VLVVPLSMHGWCHVISKFSEVGVVESKLVVCDPIKERYGELVGNTLLGGFGESPLVKKMDFSTLLKGVL